MTHLTVPHIQHVALVLYSARTKTMSSPQCLTARGSSTQPGPELWVHRSALQHVALVLSQDHAEHYGFITVPLQHVAVELNPDQNYGCITVLLQHVAVVLSLDHAEHYGFTAVPYSTWQ